MRNVFYVAGSFIALLLGPSAAFAEGGPSVYLPIGAGLAIGVAVLGGALGQAKVVSAIAESIGRNPSASGKLNLPLFVGLALIESLVILSFVIALNLANK